ncbi:MAG: glycosyltransferase family 9 protein [Verrucomicrobia bacterium]|nr:glycosyltransferase family 9 protein [Verrucomicrobiota bacterium]
MKILVISLAGIGDTLLATPLIDELKASFPNAQLDALVMWAGSRDLLAGNPALHLTHHFNMLKEGPWKTFRFLSKLRQERYDVSLNTYPQSKTHYRVISRLAGARIRVSHSYDNRSWWDGFLVNRELPQTYQVHSVHQNLGLLKLIDAEPRLTSHRTRLFLSKEDESWAKDYLSSNNLSHRRLVACHVGSGTTKNLSIRRWPLDYYARLMRSLLGLHPDVRVLLMGGPEERGDHEWLLEQLRDCGGCVLAPDTRNMKQAAALLSDCRAFLSIDSALMHLAAAVEVPHQFVIETATFNKTIEPFARPYVLIPNPAVKGRNLDYYRYDGEGIRGTREELEALMRSVQPETVFETMAPALTSP